MSREGWFAASDWNRAEEEIAGWPVSIVTYQLRGVWLCKVDNVSPGAIIARAQGATREEARSKAVQSAESRLRKTRRMPVAG